MMKKTVKERIIKLIIWVFRIKYSFLKPKVIHFIHQGVPYYSQWESPELVSKLVERKIRAEDDPKWKNSGAKNKLEYLNWSWSGCGMACFKMALEYFTGQKVPLVVLGKQCLVYGGYQMNQQAFNRGDYLHSLPGLFYKPFIRFIRHEYGLTGRVSRFLTVEQIAYEISRKNLVIVSVSADIADQQNYSGSKGGHLILVNGYDLPKKQLIFHNPSGKNTKNQQLARINFQDFIRYFDNKGMVIFDPA